MAVSGAAMMLHLPNTHLRRAPSLLSDIYIFDKVPIAF